MILYGGSAPLEAAAQGWQGGKRWGRGGSPGHLLEDFVVLSLLLAVSPVVFPFLVRDDPDIFFREGLFDGHLRLVPPWPDLLRHLCHQELARGGGTLRTSISVRQRTAVMCRRTMMVGTTEQTIRSYNGFPVRRAFISPNCMACGACPGQSIPYIGFNDSNDLMYPVHVASTPAASVIWPTHRNRREWPSGDTVSFQCWPSDGQSSAVCQVDTTYMHLQ